MALTFHTFHIMYKEKKGSERERKSLLDVWTAFQLVYQT